MAKIMQKYVTIGHARKLLKMKNRSCVEYYIKNGGLDVVYVSKGTTASIRLLFREQVETLSEHLKPQEY